MIVKRIGVWSLAKIAGLVYGGMGLISAAIFGLFSLFNLLGMATVYAVEVDQSWGVAGALLSKLPVAGAVLLMPLFYGLTGLVGGAITALIYNLVARLVGGLRLELESAPMPEAHPSPPMPSP